MALLKQGIQLKKQKPERLAINVGSRIVELILDRCFHGPPHQVLARKTIDLTECWGSLKRIQRIGMKRSILFSLSVAFLLGSLSPLQLAAQNRPASRNVETRMLDNLFRAPRNVEATAEQLAELQALREKLESELAPKMVALQRQLSAVLPPRTEYERTNQPPTDRLLKDLPTHIRRVGERHRSRPKQKRPAAKIHQSERLANPHLRTQLGGTRPSDTARHRRRLRSSRPSSPASGT